MNLIAHCQLCEHQLFNIQNGTKCGLTNEKSDFSIKCPDIKFETKYKERIKEINIEYELVRRTKAISLGNFFFFGAISLAFVIGGYLLGTFAFDKGVISTVPLIIIGIGVAVIPMAAGPLNKYRWGVKVAKDKKDELDELLSKYNVQYSIDVMVSKDLHGNQDISATLTFLQRHTKSF